MLIAAVVSALGSFGSDSSSLDFVARLLAGAAMLLFACGYGLALWACRGASRRPALVSALRAVSAGAWIVDALIGAYWVVLINDSVASGVRVALTVLFLIGAVSGVLAGLATLLGRRTSHRR